MGNCIVTRKEAEKIKAKRDKIYFNILCDGESADMNLAITTSIYLLSEKINRPYDTNSGISIQMAETIMARLEVDRILTVYMKEKNLNADDPLKIHELYMAMFSDPKLFCYNITRVTPETHLCHFGDTCPFTQSKNSSDA